LPKLLGLVLSVEVRRVPAPGSPAAPALWPHRNSRSRSLSRAKANRKPHKTLSLLVSLASLCIGLQ
jgi:hypothetical protein